MAEIEFETAKTVEREIEGAINHDDTPSRRRTEAQWASHIAEWESRAPGQLNWFSLASAAAALWKYIPLRCILQKWPELVNKFGEKNKQTLLHDVESHVHSHPSIDQDLMRSVLVTVEAKADVNAQVP